MTDVQSQRRQAAAPGLALAGPAQFRRQGGAFLIRLRPFDRVEYPPPGRRLPLSRTPAVQSR